MSSTGLSTKYLGKKKRIAATLFLSMGLLSFFQPLVVISPSALGRARWSIFDLPRQSLKDSQVAVLIGFGLPYLLILFALLSICFFPVQRLLAWTGLIGMFLGLETLRFRPDLHRVFYGPLDLGANSVKLNGLVLVLTLVMLVLFLVSIQDLLEKTAVHEVAQ